MKTRKAAPAKTDPCIVLSAEDVRRMARRAGSYIHLHPFQPDTPAPTDENDLVTWRTQQLASSPAPEAGALVWVREPFYVEPATLYSSEPVVRYAATEDGNHKYPWEPPLRMEKIHARLWLRVASVSLCRMFELCSGAGRDRLGFDNREMFGRYWDARTKGVQAFRWWNNPWVAVAEYKKEPQP